MEMHQARPGQVGHLAVAGMHFTGSEGRFAAFVFPCRPYFEAHVSTTATVGPPVHDRTS